MAFPAPATAFPWPRALDFAPVRVTAQSAIPDPLSLELIKLQCRVETDDEIELLRHYMRSARDHIEGDRGIGGFLLTSQTWRQDYTAFGDYLWLPNFPVQSVTSVQYWNAATPSVQATVGSSNYELRQDEFGYYVSPVSGFSWPSIGSAARAVSITYVAGFGSTPESVPADITHAMLLMVSEAYTNRQEVKFSSAVETLLEKHRRRNV